MEEDVDGEGSVCLGKMGCLSGIWSISVLSAQFCCEPKSALENKIFSEKDKYCMISLISGILTKKKNLIEKEIRLVVTRGRDGERGIGGR